VFSRTSSVEVTPPVWIGYCVPSTRTDAASSGQPSSAYGSAMAETGIVP
jgi:hypothetical protein